MNRDYARHGAVVGFSTVFLVRATVADPYGLFTRLVPVEGKLCLAQSPKRRISARRPCRIPRVATVGAANWRRGRTDAPAYRLAGERRVDIKWLNQLLGRAKSGSAPDLADLTAHLALDPFAESAAEDQLPFMAPPGGARPYHGFKVLEDVTYQGFTLGAITDFIKRPGLLVGDGFIVAPDGSRAGLEWRIANETYLLEMAPPTAHRWGVWMAGFTNQMVDKDSARRNLIEVEPLLREKWEGWLTDFATE